MPVQTHHRSRGYTLLELTMASFLIGTVFVAVLGAVSTLMETTSVQAQQAELEDLAYQVMARIEMSIRLSDKVLESGPGLLALQSRYCLDRDEGVELLRYKLVGSRLQLETAMDGTKYGAPEVILSDVDRFECDYVHFSDSLEPSSFTTALATGDVSVMVVTGAAEQTITQLDAVDSDLLSSYNVERQRLEVTGAAGQVRTVTISPRIRKKKLKLTTTFTPLTSNAEYRPLVWGDAAVGGDSTAVVFLPNGSMSLKGNAGGVQSSDVGPELWSPLASYEVRLEIDKHHTKAKISTNGGKFTEIGKFDTLNYDSKPVHLQVVTPGAVGAWDNLDVSYSLVEVVLGMRQREHSLEIVGAASIRAKP